MKPKPTARGSRRSPEHSQRAILEAAAREFATEGVAGARTDAIARAAGVNKALLYYYFEDKEALYGAVLQHVLGDLLQQVTQIVESPGSARYRMLAYAATHFNFVAAHAEQRRIMQFEMMRAGAGHSPHFEKLADVFFRPMMVRLTALLEEGIGNGEFRKVHPQHCLQSIFSAIIFHFIALPILRTMMPVDPLSAPALRQRRDAVLDFISGALFQDRDSAAAIIAEVNRKVAQVPSDASGKPHRRGKK